MQEDVYLTTAEAAAYLRLKERKIYEMVAEGTVPCTKVTGKWLFPRAALDRWLAAGLVQPAGFSPAPAPPVIGGSHDPLLEWLVRESGCGLALLTEGSEAGLDRLARDEVAIASIHCHGPRAEDDDGANLAAARSRQEFHDVVIVAFARRSQGLLVAPGNPLGIAGLGDAASKQARFATRQPGAGAQMLLRQLLARDGIAADRLKTTASPYATGQELAFAIRAGRADCGIASQSVASAHGLEFLPLVWERFDLALRRRTYFDAGPQVLFAAMRAPAFAQRAAEFGGYDIAGSGDVRLNM
jgi:excisionase family DNA binding protein